MSKLFARTALVGCAAAGVAGAQTAPVLPAPTPPIVVQMTTPATPTLAARMPPVVPSKLILQTLDVADLVCPPADSPLAKPGTDPAMVAAAKAFTEVRSEELMKSIRAGTNRWCWDESGGVGKLAVTTDGKTLVVNNTLAVVRDVTTCVDGIRKHRSAQVKVDLVVIKVPSKNEAMAKLLGDKGHAAVSADEFNVMLRELKESGEVKVLTRPTLMVRNNQTGFFQVGGQVALPAPVGGPVTFQPVGLTTRVTPEVSADMKSVALVLEFEHCEACGGPLPAFNSQHVKSNLVLPDGGTMAVKVSTLKEERRFEQKVPVVSDIPYMGHLFRNVSSTTEPVDTVAVVTVTRVNDAPCPLVAIAPPVAAVPPMMSTTMLPPPTIQPTVTLTPPMGRLAPPMMPAPVAAPTCQPYATPVTMPQSVPLTRTIGPDGLERVGVDFNTLTTGGTLPKAVTGVRMVAQPGTQMYRFTNGEVVAVTGGTVGVTAETCDSTCSLMTAYKAACAAGNKDEATRLALKLLANDPTCFGKK